MNMVENKDTTGFLESSDRILKFNIMEKMEKVNIEGVETISNV